MSGGNSNPTSGGTPAPIPGQPSWAGGPVQTSFDPKTLGSQLGGDIQTLYSKGPGTLPTSLYAGLGANTNAGLGQLLGLDTSDYSKGIGSAISDYADTAAGHKVGMQDPGYAAVRDKLQSDIMGSVGSGFAASGRYGGGSYVGKAVDSLSSGLGALDMQQYDNSLARQDDAAKMLPGLYQSLMMPGQTRLGVGAVQDQSAQAALDAQNHLLDMKNNQGYDQLAKYVALLNSGTSGTNPNIAAQTPWWQTLLSTGATIGGGILGALA